MNPAELFRRQGTEVISQSECENTPFCLAHESQAVSIQILKEAGVDISMLNINGKTPLHLAVLTHNQETVRAVIKAGIGINSKDVWGRTPLIEAILHCSTFVATTLLEAGADVNILDKDGWTPLHFAASQGNVDLVKALLKAGGIVDAKDHLGNTPLRRTALSNRIELLKGHLKIEDKNGKRPLRTASQDYEDVARALLEAGADANIKAGADPFNGESTLLHFAVEEDNVDLVKALLEAGAIVNAVDKNGFTPLRIAVCRNHKDVARALLEAGANVNISDKGKDTPLHFAASKGNVDLVKALLEAGAIVNAVNKDGCTPLRIAADHDNEDVARALLEAGTDANMFGEGEWSRLLFIAVSRGSVGVVKALLEADTIVNIRDFGYLLAASARHSIIVDLILVQIAKLNAAFQYIGEADLLSKINFSGSTFLLNTISGKRQVYAQEIERMKEADATFYDFLKENGLNKVVSIWEKSAGVLSCRLDDLAYLKTEFPNYSQILINKANSVKKYIFIHNHKPLVDFLSAHYRADIQAIAFPSIKRFFNFHRLDFMQELGGSKTLTLIDFVDFTDIVVRSVPKLKVIVFGKAIKSRCFCSTNSSNQLKSAQSSHRVCRPVL